jgi:hypothetical protein
MSSTNIRSGCVARYHYSYIELYSSTRAPNAFTAMKILGDDKMLAFTKAVTEGHAVYHSGGKSSAFGNSLYAHIEQDCKHS